VQSLDDRLRALAEALEDSQPAPRAVIERRASQLRWRRRGVQAAGAMAASIMVAAATVAVLHAHDDAAVVTNSRPPTSEATVTTTATAPPGQTSASTVPTSPGTTPSDPTTVAERPGSLTSATTAIRSACRRFYGFNVTDVSPPPGGNTTGTSLLTEPELASRCDQPRIEFKAGCYAPRPATFVPGEGGCANLGGYLAVYYGAPADPTSGYATDPTHRFQVGDDVWWIYPESD
jgi:hypothetical protein